MAFEGFESYCMTKRIQLDKVELTLPRGSTAEATKAWFQSALLFVDNKLVASEKLRQMHPSLSQKFNSYVLPTPVDAKSSTSSGSNNPKPSKMQGKLSEPTKNLWHSSLLEQKEHEKHIGHEFSASIFKSAQSVLKESNSNTTSTRLSPPLVDNVL
ncbi:hypothetical protein JHK87_000573 [Glycine soja]|nr:hypothetical protein JHK87_000573 [Glycine soja]